MKTCTKCGEEKPFEAFHKDKTRKDGYRDVCKECVNNRNNELKKNPLMQLKKIVVSSIKIENKLLLLEGKKLCCCCKGIYKIEDTPSTKICRKCNRKNYEKYKEKNKEKYRENKKKYRENNKEKIRQYNKEYTLKKKLEKQQILIKD